MPVEIDVFYPGALRTEARHAPSGSELVTDAPADNQGKGETFSPTDLVATALASCMITTMGIVARRHGIPLEGTTARVVKHMVSDPHRRIGRLEVVMRMPAGISLGQRRLLERTAHTCPVERSLAPEVERSIEFVWDD